MTHVFHRSLLQDYPVAVRGDGMYLIDAAGKRYLDACGGAAVSCLGHSERTVIDAIKAQLDRLPYAHTSFFTNEPMEALADELIASAPDGMSHVYFVSGGSEAMEAALKLARQYFLEAGQPQRRHVVARLQSYHGNTLGALATGGNVWRRRQYEPLLFPAQHVSACYARPRGIASPLYGSRRGTSHCAYEGALTLSPGSCLITKTRRMQMGSAARNRISPIDQIASCLQVRHRLLLAAILLSRLTKGPQQD